MSGPVQAQVLAEQLGYHLGHGPGRQEALLHSASSILLSMNTSSTYLGLGSPVAGTGSTAARRPLTLSFKGKLSSSGMAAVKGPLRQHPCGSPTGMGEAFTG